MLHLKPLMQSDRHALGMFSIPPIEILYFLLREHKKLSEFQLHLKFMLSSNTYLSLLTIRLKSMKLPSENFLQFNKKLFQEVLSFAVSKHQNQFMQISSGYGNQLLIKEIWVIRILQKTEELYNCVLFKAALKVKSQYS